VKEEEEEDDLSPEIAPLSPMKSKRSLAFSGTESSGVGSNSKTFASRNWSKALNTVSYMNKFKAAISPKLIERTLRKYFA